MPIGKNKNRDIIIHFDEYYVISSDLRVKNNTILPKKKNKRNKKLQKFLLLFFQKLIMKMKYQQIHLTKWFQPFN